MSKELFHTALCYVFSAFDQTQSNKNLKETILYKSYYVFDEYEKCARSCKQNSGQNRPQESNFIQ